VSPIRGIAGLCLLALAGWALLAVFSPPAEEAPPQSFTSSWQCRECHPAAFAEWEGSQHALSWTNPAVRALSNDFANTNCIDCHAPRPIFETGLAMRVLPRSSRRQEGVDCISCHLLPDGRVAGTIDRPSAPCRPVLRVELQRPEYCGVCHDQHGTVQQWKASRWPEAGLGCIDCHMPRREGDPAGGRDHRCLGGNDLGLLRAAVDLRGRREAGRWVIEIENVGAGHAFPTDERSRAADLFWRPLPSPGAEPGPWRHFHRIRDPYRQEVDLVSNLLQAHELRRLPLEEEEARGAIEVALFYLRSPYYDDMEAPDPLTKADAVLVHRVELRP
jgi:hypothetical protein